MIDLVSTWKPYRDYSELDVIRFFDKCSMLINPEHKPVPATYTRTALPIVPKVVSNTKMGFSNEEFINELIREYPDLNIDEMRLWKEL